MSPVVGCNGSLGRELYRREFTKVLYSAVADFCTLQYRKLRSVVFTVKTVPREGTSALRIEQCTVSTGYAPSRTITRHSVRSETNLHHTHHSHITGYSHHTSAPQSRVTVTIEMAV